MQLVTYVSGRLGAILAEVYWFIWGVFLLKLPGYLDRTDD